MSARPRTDRRLAARKARHECTWLVSVRLRPGRDVRVVDLSNGGALVEGLVRLMPGSPIELHVLCLDARHTVRGRVLRCYVSAIGPAGVCYRAALGFERPFCPPSPTPKGDECDV